MSDPWERHEAALREAGAMRIRLEADLADECENATPLTWRGDGPRLASCARPTAGAYAVRPHGAWWNDLQVSANRFEVAASAWWSRWATDNHLVDHQASATAPTPSEALAKLLATVRAECSAVPDNWTGPMGG